MAKAGAFVLDEAQFEPLNEDHARQSHQIQGVWGLSHLQWSHSTRLATCAFLHKKKMHLLVKLDRLASLLSIRSNRLPSPR